MTVVPKTLAPNWGKLFRLASGLDHATQLAAWCALNALPRNRDNRIALARAMRTVAEHGIHQEVMFNDNFNGIWGDIHSPSEITIPSAEVVIGRLLKLHDNGNILRAMNGALVNIADKRELNIFARINYGKLAFEDSPLGGVFRITHRSHPPVTFCATQIESIEIGGKIHIELNDPQAIITNAETRLYSAENVSL